MAWEIPDFALRRITSYNSGLILEGTCQFAVQNAFSKHRFRLNQYAVSDPQESRNYSSVDKAAQFKYIAL
jgi:hypothetical protein